MCYPFKRAWGGVYRTAQLQNCLDWFMIYCKGPAKKKRILLLYLKTKGESGLDRSLAVPTFVFAAVKQELVAEQRVKKSGHGKMWKGEY